MDTKNLRIHSILLVHSVGGTTNYITADEPTQSITSAATVAREGDGYWIKDGRGIVYWTPAVNVISVKWGAPRAEAGKK